MVSRRQTARPLLPPGEVMQLPPTDELVLVSGLHPIRAKKARFYEDAQLNARVLAPPKPGSAPIAQTSKVQQRTDDWTTLVLPVTRPQPGNSTTEVKRLGEDDPAIGGIRREPELPEHEEIELQPPPPARECEFDEEDRDEADAAMKGVFIDLHVSLPRSAASICQTGRLVEWRRS